MRVGFFCLPLTSRANSIIDSNTINGAQTLGLWAVFMCLRGSKSSSCGGITQQKEHFFECVACDVSLRLSAHRHMDCWPGRSDRAAGLVHSDRIRGRCLVPRPGNAVPIRESGSKRVSVPFKVGSRPGLRGVVAPLLADLIGIRRLLIAD